MHYRGAGIYMPLSHTDRGYDDELDEIRAQVGAMGEEVCAMLARSLDALVTGDLEAARAVIGADRRVNRLEVDIDELCLRVIARRQPVASDLRLIATTLKLDTDLERIGDLCVNVCERLLELRAATPPDLAARLRATGERARERIETALRAFLSGDVTLAERVLESDAAVDRSDADIFEQLRAGTRSAKACAGLQAVARYIQRMGDHATNLAEMAIFVAQGRDVRHPGRIASSRSNGSLANASLAVVTPHDAFAARVRSSRARRQRVG